MAKPIIILVRPQLGENIGAAARVMANFGLSELRLVAPRDGWPSETAAAMAAGAEYILREAKLFATLEEALADCHCVYATTSRDRRLNKPVAEPREALADVAARTRQGQRVALVFGPERTGLDNDDISLASHLLTIPVSPEYPSLNLAQAVGVCAYEWQMARSARQSEIIECASPPCYEGVFSAEMPPKSPLPRAEEGDAQRRVRDTARMDTLTPTLSRNQEREKYVLPHGEGLRHQPAPRAELFGFFDHLEEVLGEAGFYKTAQIKPNMDRNLRALFQRAELTSQEISTLRGILRALTDPIQNPRWKSLKNKGKKSS